MAHDSGPAGPQTPDGVPAGHQTPAAAPAVPQSPDAAPAGRLSPDAEPVVVIPRAGRWGEHTAALVRGHGLRPWVLPLIRTQPVRSPEVDRALAGAAAGQFDWVVLTSAAAVPVLTDGAPAPDAATAATYPAAGESAAKLGAPRARPRPIRARIAAVGPRTAAALHAAGYAVDYVPADHSAQGLLHAGQLRGRMLLLRSDLAAPTLADGLRATGEQVSDVVAYRTHACDLADDDAAALAAGDAAAVLVTSGSVARSLARFDLAPGTLVLCLGPGTAAAARAAGLEVRAVAPERTIDSLVRAARVVLDGAAPARTDPALADQPRTTPRNLEDEP